MEINTFTDEECIDFIKTLLAERMQIATAYVQNPETGVLTDQVLIIKCGEQEMVSSPEKLAVPFMPVMSPEETIN